MVNRARRPAPHRSGINRINAASKPLALYVYSRDDALVDTVLAQTSSGGACLNHAMIHYMHSHLPFGGMNNSGLGNANGRHGFRTFSNERGIVKTQLALAPKLLKAGEVPEWLLNWVKKPFRFL